MSLSPNILFVDNFDSFSFNLVDEFAKRGSHVEVWRNDIPAGRALALALALPAPRLIVLSPGPGSPAEAGCTIELVRLAAGRIPVFGVCLGHQAIVEAFGGKVAFAGEVVHGKTSRVTHDGRGIFHGLPSPFAAARYHSLAAERVPDSLLVTARAGALVMAVAHRSLPVTGVQFHPESILTSHGGRLIENVMSWAGGGGGQEAACGNS